MSCLHTTDALRQAPELLLEAAQVTMEADVYAYGMVVLEALTGKEPYEGISEAQVLSLVMRKKVPPPPDEISDGLWELLNSCWAPDPAKRPNIVTVANRLGALFPSTSTNRASARQQGR